MAKQPVKRKTRVEVTPPQKTIGGATTDHGRFPYDDLTKFAKETRTSGC